MSDAGPPVQHPGEPPVPQQPQYAEPQYYAEEPQYAEQPPAAGEPQYYAEEPQYAEPQYAEEQPYYEQQPEYAEEPQYAEQPAAPRKRGMFADPLVRAMAMLAIGIVIVMLVGVVGVLQAGLIDPTGPRSLSEKELLVTGQAVRQGGATALMWANYVSALIENGRLSEAESAIKDGRASVNDTATADFSVAEARLYIARKEYKQAIAVANKGQKQITDVYNKGVAAGGQTEMLTKAAGISDNWFVLALIKADAYKATSNWTKVIAELDTYIKKYPDASDILVDRGNAKIKIKDTAGAAADFRLALKYIPDDKEALAGLKSIGASSK
jgi:hypothetical protein